MSVYEVGLRVVGVYYNATIRFEFDDADGLRPTVKRVCDEAAMQPPTGDRGAIFFDYRMKRFSQTGAYKPSLFSVTHSYPGQYDYDGNNSLRDIGDGATLNNIRLPAGPYSLAEQAIPGGFLGWQHYLIRDESGGDPRHGGRVVSKTPPTRGFNSSADQPVETGDLVIWRLVAIAKQQDDFV